MMLAFLVWLVMTVLPAVKGLGVFLFLASVLGLIAGGLGAIDFGVGNCVLTFMRRNLKWAVPVMLLALFTPNKETTWYMVGAYATQTVVQSETGQQLAGDSLDVLKSLIKKSKEYIDSVDVKKETPAVKTEQPKGEKA